MKFDSPGRLEDLIWQSRIADLPRGENRAILQRMYGGDPPFDPEKAEENNIEVNRNDLTGVNLLASARRQWLSAFLAQKNFFTVTLDSGPAQYRQGWSGTITRAINRRLRRNPRMREQIRATGANVMLHGIGPVCWPDRRSPVPVPIPISSLMIASETDVDFENLEWFSVFREWTPAQLYQMTHGPKVDPGWNLEVVSNQLKYVGEQVQKQPNATAYQYMPERIEELVKQDMGFWGSDAVPTIDVWDTYFREAEDGKGWYRRILLDWGITNSDMKQYATAGRPPSRNTDGRNSTFIYTSDKRKYANSHGEIMHCQFGDLSAYAPFKYHSVRSLGWMLWGACDLQNRLYCKFMENAFMNLMWWFRVSGEQAFNRIKRADFFHMGVIPQGIQMVPNGERFQPDPRIVDLAFARNRQLLSENAASFMQDFSKGESGKEMTATETMARVNQVNALVSGMLALAYSYEESKYREICRRFCIRNNPDRDARGFRKECLESGVPEKMLDPDRWNVEAERVLGGGNKTLEMATVNFLNTIRKNMGPQGQRIIDHISVFSATDQADLAEEIAPLNEEKPISDSMHDAQLGTERLMRNLPLVISPKMIPEDYIKVWMADLALMVQTAQKTGGMATKDQIAGWSNIAKHVQQFLEIMASNEEEIPKVKAYQDQLAQIMNFVKAFAQRLAQQLMKGNGDQGGGIAAIDAETQAKLKGKLLIDQAKAQNMRESHALRTAQKEAAFELDEQRKEREHRADLRRSGAQADHEMATDTLKAFKEVTNAGNRPGTTG